MDEFLNELYGTSQIISGDDLEKQAAAEFLIKLAEQEGVDLDTLSDAEVGQLLSEIESGQVKQAQAQTQDTEAQEKLAEADFLGRAMAHAYVNELHEIEKSAAGRSGGGQISEAAAKKMEAAAAAERAAKRNAAAYSGPAAAGSGASGGRQVGRLEAGARQAGQAIKGYHQKGVQELRAALKGGAGRSAMQRLGHLGRGAARFAPHTAAAGLAAYGLGKAMGGEKEARSFNEQFEQMARQRAYEMLAEAGYDVEKVAQADVETAALQMLEQAGYPVQWNQG